MYFYRGSVTLVSGTPGCMKTMFLLSLVDELRVPTLYISNDSNEMTVISRLLARRTGIDSLITRERAIEDPEWAGRLLADLDWVRWSFAASPTLEDVEEEVRAFEELWGEMPHLVVVDVLGKIDYSTGDYTGDEDIVRYLDRVARESGACVVIASHTSENVLGNPCQPLGALLNKIGKFPVMVLTLAHVSGVLYVAPVKNRDGFADSSGRSYVTFLIDPALARLEEVDG
jgi:KaiC/GvpD/RAD55 family RecA-like ATPase